MSGNNPGQFVISLDTELAWGSFDTGGVSRHETEYRNTRSVINDLCTLFDEYDAPVTWAVVMHLLEDCTTHEELVPPKYEWVNWLEAIPCRAGVDEELWYAPDIVDRIQSSGVNHEIGLHGYTHMIMGASGCSREAARSEIKMAVQTANKAGIEPDTYIFPRNRIGHLGLLDEFDISVYRGVDGRWYEQNLPEKVRKPLRFADEAFKFTPPVVTPVRRNGLVELPGSQILRPYKGPWNRTPADSQLIRAKKGLDEAARTGKVYHLWFHPFNLATGSKRHLEVVKAILSYASELRDQDKLEICPMIEAANI